MRGTELRRLFAESLKLNTHSDWTIEIFLMALSTVFVTGASGFIGSHLIKELTRREASLKCLVRPTSDVSRLQAKNVQLVYGDLVEPESYRNAIPGCDTVIHLAGLTHALTRKQMFRINTTAARDLADVCAATDNPPRLVSISSLAAAGPPTNGSKICHETDLPVPMSDYGCSKREGEIEFQRRASRIPITLIRPGLGYGPRDHGMAEVAKPIYRLRVHTVVGFRAPPLSFLFVEDLVQLIIEAAERAETLDPTVVDEYSSQGIYFACDDSEYPDYGELGRRIARLLDRLRKRSSFLNVDKVREGTARSWACAADKARQQLGLAPEKTLDERLKETLDWLVHERWI